MAGRIFNSALNFLGWEVEEEEVHAQEAVKEEGEQPASSPTNLPKSKSQSVNKVVNLHTQQQQQFKVIIMNPENFEDAKEICEHLKNRKPVVINLIELDKDFAQRILDFLSGGVCALDGSIQKVSQGIFVVAPNNVDVMGEFKDELRNKAALFPWVR